VGCLSKEELAELSTQTENQVQASVATRAPSGSAVATVEEKLLMY
jgi:hypothetical protein